MNGLQTKSIEKVKPFADLLQRLNSILREIDNKTKAFQIDYPRAVDKEPKIGSEFGQELQKTIELAEDINSKLPF